MAQQASPEPNGQSEFFWAQVMSCVGLVRRKGVFPVGSVNAPPEIQGSALQA